MEGMWIPCGHVRCWNNGDLVFWCPTPTLQSITVTPDFGCAHRWRDLALYFYWHWSDMRYALVDRWDGISNAEDLQVCVVHDSRMRNTRLWKVWNMAAPQGILWTAPTTCSRTALNAHQIYGYKFKKKIYEYMHEALNKIKKITHYTI